MSNLPNNTNNTLNQHNITDKNIKLYPALSSLETKNNNNMISILSYNTLYKDWVNKERYPFIKNDEYRTWNYRLPRIVDTICKYKADIVCLQEIDVDPKTFEKDFGDYFKRKTNLCYEYALGPCIKMKIKKRESDGHWGNAVLFNSKRFKLIHKEFLKKNPREMLLLFTDIIGMEKCENCCLSSSICCIYHSFFVINVHLPGHPNKWRSRLNSAQRIINKLKMFGTRYKTKKVEKKAIKINTNINGNWKNMRIIICGDFNAPKTGNIDNLLMDKFIDINNYNMTRNIYEEEKKQDDIKQNECLLNKSNNKKIVRFTVDSKRIGAVIGEKGAKIEEIREKTKAGIWIGDACKARYGLKGQSMISIKGTMDVINSAIDIIIDVLAAEVIDNKIMNKVVLFMDIQNIELFDVTKGVGNSCNVELSVSIKPLPFSTEKTIEIIGGIDGIKKSLNMMVERLFNDERCIETEKLYNPQIELDANFNHGFDFNDSYHEGLLSIFNNNDCNDDMDDYYDRIKYFPTYGDGTAVGSMDYIYYTQNNIELIGITKTLNDNDELIGNIGSEIDRIRNDDDGNDKHKQQGVLSNILELPNDKLISDHLPIATMFKLINTCDNKEKCECFKEGQKGGRLRSKINKNKKKKKNQKKNNVNPDKNDWIWHEMHSF